MDIVVWIFVGLFTMLFTALYVLDEIEYCKRINELAKKGKVIWIIRL